MPRMTHSETYHGSGLRSAITTHRIDVARWRHWFLDTDLPLFDPDFNVRTGDYAYESASFFRRKQMKATVTLFRVHIPLSVRYFVFFTIRSLFQTAYRDSPPRGISDSSLSIILLYVWSGYCGWEESAQQRQRPEQAHPQENVPGRLMSQPHEQMRALGFVSNRSNE